MKCEDWRAEISAWMDSELDDQSQRALFEHMAECADCRMFLEGARRIDRALKFERKAYFGGARTGSTDPASVLRRRILMSVSSLVLTLFLASFLAFVLGVTLSRPRFVDAPPFPGGISQQGMIRTSSWQGQQ